MELKKVESHLPSIYVSKKHEGYSWEGFAVHDFNEALDLQNFFEFILVVFHVQLSLDSLESF